MKFTVRHFKQFEMRVYEEEVGENKPWHNKYHKLDSDKF